MDLADEVSVGTRMGCLSINDKQLSFRLFLHLFLAFSSQEHELGKVIPIDSIIGIDINLVEEGSHLATAEVVAQNRGKSRFKFFKV